MNYSFDPLDLVNTTAHSERLVRERDEIIFEGTEKRRHYGETNGKNTNL